MREVDLSVVPIVTVDVEHRAWMAESMLRSLTRPFARGGSFGATAQPYGAGAFTCHPTLLHLRAGLTTSLSTLCQKCITCELPLIAQEVQSNSPLNSTRMHVGICMYTLS
jgi:hypothetical protein